MKILVLLLVFSSFNVNAAWNVQSQSKIRQMEEDYKNMGTGELASAWGTWKRTHLFSPTISGKVIKVPTNETRQGFVNAYFYKIPTNASRPLIVYFPRMFGEIGDKLTDDFVSKIEELNVHVLVIPNFLSHSWIQAQPIYDKHPVKTEIFIIAAIWKEMLKQIPKDNISETHFIGEGLGGILASAWAAQMDFTPRPLTVSLLWPPAEFDTSMINLDAFIESSSKDWANCGSIGTFPTFLNYFILSDTPVGISKSDDQCLSAWGANREYVKNLHSLSTLNAHITNGQVTRPKNFQYFFEHSYKTFFRAITKKDEMLHLGYWINSIRKSQPALDVRILTSFDDFFNKGIPLAEVARKANLQPENIMVMNWGGHGGPIGTPEFTEVLTFEFKRNAN
ncbi:MAG TPA: hypothetical protein VNJ08_12320 [Bacteriovoracaceae bacterium]|nr:hypothetical protein [Bacteriovoracaceae bacterium]